jgi:CheY-like chemotaxis protein
MQFSETEMPVLRIVIADDNRDTAISASVLLEKFGFEIAGVAFDGYSAFALIQSEQPDVAILDIALPQLDGYEIAKRVRQSAMIQPKLVAVTGLSRTCDRLDAAAAGFNAFFSKPINWTELEELLRSYLPPHSVDGN